MVNIGYLVILPSPFFLQSFAFEHVPNNNGHMRDIEDAHQVIFIVSYAICTSIMFSRYLYMAVLLVTVNTHYFDKINMNVVNDIVYYIYRYWFLSFWTKSCILIPNSKKEYFLRIWMYNNRITNEYSWLVRRILNLDERSGLALQRFPDKCWHLVHLNIKYLYLINNFLFFFCDLNF